MSGAPVRDVGGLSTVAFGHRMPIWWGNAGFMVIEGTGFVMAIGAYFYLASQNPDWPMGNTPPALTWGTTLVGWLLLTELPNFWVKRVAKQYDVRRTRRGVAIMALVGLGALGLRALEFGTLNCRWDTNAYGSIVWALMFLHTVHIVADVSETWVIAAITVLAPLDARRFVDVTENAEYWDFIVLTWIPVYVVIYWAPRWLGS
jgi:cytochrome c oxidase subunit III